MKISKGTDPDGAAEQKLARKYSGAPPQNELWILLKLGARSFLGNSYGDCNV